MRSFDMALTALALRVSTTQSPKPERRSAPVVDKADAAALDRDALNRQRVALIASLWPEGRPCVVPTLFLLLPAPALFSAPLRVSWQPPADDARPLLCGESMSQIARAA